MLIMMMYLAVSFTPPHIKVFTCADFVKFGIKYHTSLNGMKKKMLQRSIWNYKNVLRPDW